MLFFESRLPWNDLPVMSTGDLHQRISEGLPEHLRLHLPKSIEVVFDVGVAQQQVIDFVEALPLFLAGEFGRWQERLKRFTELELLTDAEIRHFMTAQRDVQPWILYYSLDGGLGHESANTDRSLPMGLIPCSAVKHHGVAWRRSADGVERVWLASARAKGAVDWDWMADVGHEVCHASFAPVPLWAQPAQDGVCADLALVKRVEDLQPQHLQKIAYTNPEIVATVIRGEYRDTETGLPGVESREELVDFLEICHQLHPETGFHQVQQSLFSSTSMKPGIKADDGIHFEIACRLILISIF
jgi:hypothetical protein